MSRCCFFRTSFRPAIWAAENCQIEKGDTVAVWGCGPIGQFAIQSAWMLGAGRVIAIDRVPERLIMAESQGKAETINFSKEEVYDHLMELRHKCSRNKRSYLDGFGCSSGRLGKVCAGRYCGAIG